MKKRTVAIALVALLAVAAVPTIAFASAQGGASDGACRRAGDCRFGAGGAEGRRGGIDRRARVSGLCRRR